MCYNAVKDQFRLRLLFPDRRLLLWQMRLNPQRLIRDLGAECLQVNSLYSYPAPPDLLDDIVANDDLTLDFFAHDHHPICSSLFLLGPDGSYCGLPTDLSQCNRCLKSLARPANFIAAGGQQRWRHSWCRFLERCALIRFFSSATYSAYVRVFPDLEHHLGVVIDGHTIKYPLRKRAVPIEGRPVNIGVFGRISQHKGSREVFSLAG